MKRYIIPVIVLYRPANFKTHWHYGMPVYCHSSYLLRMNTTPSELNRIIDLHFPALLSINEDQLISKPSPSKWSKKEIIGHLIDSAQSNIRRFIVAQYEEAPVITYQQDQWVSINAYQEWNSDELVRLWYLLNKQICTILRNTNEETWQRECMTGELHTIGWLAEDYIKHLLHHLHEVLGLDPVAYP